MVHKKVIKIALIDSNRDVLFLVRSVTHPRYPNELDLPGGIIEYGENALSGILRELKEECGITIEPQSIFKLSELQYSAAWQYYLAGAKCKEVFPKLSSEHSAYKKCNMDSLASFGPLNSARDLYMIFAKKSLINNADRITTWLSHLK